MSTKPAFGAVLAAATFLLGVASAQSSTPSQPPNCAAIAFRPILSRSGDGQQDAGLYKSRFGRIEVKAQVKDGTTQKYFVQINGKELGPAERTLPASLATCASAKRLPAPGTPEADCTGDQVTVLIDHSGEQRYVLLYVHRASAWHFCSAGIA
jgi:hypothetical protein